MSDPKRARYHKLAARIHYGSAPALVMGGHPLSSNDAKRVAVAYCLWFSLREDVCHLVDEHFALDRDKGYSRTCSASNSRLLLSQMYATDVKLIIDTFKALLQVLRHLPAEGKRTKSDSIRVIRELYAQYDVDATCCIVPDLTFMIRQVYMTGSTFLFREVNTLLQFIVRLTLKDVEWIEEENIQKYKEMEDTLHSQHYSSDLLKDVKQTITTWFSHVDWEPAVGQHGYGATYEVGRSIGTDAKYHNMIPTAEMGRFFDFVDWKPGDAIAWPHLTSRFAYAVEHSAESGVLHASDMVCKMQLVPKGVDKKRVISMEPTVHQFGQKMINAVMSNHFDRHPEMHINLHNQEYNRSLCLKGSKRGKYATIDLSSASDTVTYTLVEYLFRDTPLYYPLMWTRTTKVELPDGSVIPLEKFAPMGSSCCFPVECTVFSAIIASVQKRLGVHYYYRVYGDDMVVHKNVYRAVLQALRDLIFVVNEDKSFGDGSLFTESCGIEAWKGDDVSPMRLSRKFDPVEMCSYFLRKKKRHRSKDDGVTQLYDMYDIGNEAYEREYFSLRRAIIRITQELCPACVFSHNREHGFLTFGNVLSRAHRLRFDRKTRTMYVRVFCLRMRTDPGEEELRYSKLLEDYLSCSRERLLLPDDRKDVKSGAATTYGSYVWARLDDLERWFFEPSPSQLSEQSIASNYWTLGSGMEY